MTREKAQQAIDEAFADGLKNLFSKLVLMVETEEVDAVNRFKAGVAFHDHAHAAASAAVEAIFPE
jgi:hypothetical protein